MNKPPNLHTPIFISKSKLHKTPTKLEGKVQNMNINWSGGDWICGVCEHLNFKKREACQRCGYPKYGGPDPTTYEYNNKTEVLAGDWYCNCGAHNYASRSTCYRCNNVLKNNVDIGALPGWKSGDWICNRIGCEMHNYASRMECYKCKTPRDFGGGVCN